jgi:hypothetical protein
MIKISNAILDAVESTSEYYLNKRPWLYKLAERGFNNIRNPYQYIPAIHVIAMDVSLRTAILPDEVFSILGFIPGDQGVNSWQMFYNYCTQDLPYIASQIQWIGGQTLPLDMNPGSQPYNIVDKTIIFNSPVTFDHITVLTKDKVIDSSGELMIPEECLEVVSKFIQIQLDELELRDAIRRREINYVASNKIKEEKQEYSTLMRRTRGRLNNLQEEATDSLMHYFSGKW